MSGVDLLLMIGNNGGGMLTAAIGPGVAASGPSHGNVFPTNTCAVSGGSGSYTYFWTFFNVGGVWNTGTGSSLAIAVTDVPPGGQGGFGIANAWYVCTVTDTVTHKTVVSNTAWYQWTDTI